MKVFVLLIAVFVLSAGKGYACSCIKPEAPVALARAQAVFVGQVIDVSDPLSIDPEAPLSERFFRIRFQVERAWKGAPFSGEVTVLSAQGNFSCFAHPPVHLLDRYLIYAESAGGWPIISNCSRTALLTDPITPVEPLREAAPFWHSPERRVRLDAEDANADADLRLLESLLFPSIEYALPPLKRTPADKLPLMIFAEPFKGRSIY
jgi:hypothetical protein